MIPNRAPAPRTNDLTMFRYQERVEPPPIPSNAEQRRVAAENAQLPPMPKKIGRPRKHPPKPKCADPQKSKGETLSAMHARRIKKQVAKLFAAGPLTVDMIMCELGYTVRQAAGRRVLDWRDRGLIVEVMGPKTGDGRKDMAKWWGLKK